MLNLEVSTSIYIQLAPAIKGRRENAPFRKKKTKTRTIIKIVHKSLASLQLSLKLLQWLTVRFIQLLFFLLFSTFKIFICLTYYAVFNYIFFG